MKHTSLFLLLVTGICIAFSCRKTNNAPVLSAFADSLQKTCNGFFVGPGDYSEIYSPTAFTPNGDGINDLYGVFCDSCYLADYFKSFQATIYDTTGKLVHQANGYDRWLWDGTDTTTGKLSTEYKFYVEISYTTKGNKSYNAGTFLYILPTDSAKHCVTLVLADTSKYEFPDQFDVQAGFIPGDPNENFCN